MNQNNYRLVIGLGSCGQENIESIAPALIKFNDGNEVEFPLFLVGGKREMLEPELIRIIKQFFDTLEKENISG